MLQLQIICTQHRNMPTYNTNIKSHKRKNWHYLNNSGLRPHFDQCTDHPDRRPIKKHTHTQKSKYNTEVNQQIRREENKIGKQEGKEKRPTKTNPKQSTKWQY